MCYAALFVWIDLELDPNAADLLRSTLCPADSSKKLVPRKEFLGYLLRRLPEKQPAAKA